MVALWILILTVMQLMIIVLTQNPAGFINIACGLSNGETQDPSTGLTYTSDAEYAESGEAQTISDASITQLHPDQFKSSRSFPNGSRNCYTLKQLVQGEKYLVRAWFMHGNYDGKSASQISFDLYLDSQLWEKLVINDPALAYSSDLLTIPRTNYTSICLVNTNGGTPFISVLELRQLKSTIYPALITGISLKLFARYNMGGVPNSTIRYRGDPYDRLWPSGTIENCFNISTHSSIDMKTNDNFEVPSAVLQTAVTPNTFGSLKFSLTELINQVGKNLQTHVYMSFAGFNSTASTLFNVYLNNNLLHLTGVEAPFSVLYLKPRAISIRSSALAEYGVSLNPDPNSVLAPLLNALEVYAVINGSNGLYQPTSDQDFKFFQNSFVVKRMFYALMAIKDQYKVKKNWMGDPCSPQSVIWEGLACNYSTNSSVVKKVNLSSSDLTGEISTYFSSLTSIDSLDLSLNGLTGSIPDIFGSMLSLRFLNLSGNDLSGTVPPVLLQRSKDNSLVLSIEGNPKLCTDDEETCKRKQQQQPKKKLKLTIIIGIVVPVVLLLLLAPITWIIKKAGFYKREYEKQNIESNSNHLVDGMGKIVRIDFQKFTFRDLEEITRNFENEIGKGGFGAVYHGLLFNGTQVAVKVLKSSSHQGAKEFLAEVQHLSRVHHRNLVSLVGYCNNGVKMALVYEYMSGGSLRASIQGVAGKRVLSWEERLRILLGASQGISYLHCECNPPIVHRDVKTDNILLNPMHEAKIADFGLCKAFQNDCTHISTVVAGTPGYLDPEYHSSFQLNEKSDVYSFGVVMLEVLTTQTPIIETHDKRIHITEWVQQKLTKGSMDNVADTELLGRYDVNSAWKIVDLAMKCCARTSVERPIMPDVVSDLKESLELVLDLKKTRRISSLRTSSSGTTAFEAKSDEDLMFDGPSMR
ncbi:hypothetical protein LUZ60_000476 [Juncus effusus]|nr:hypothetical protein LUZ60_000476 [Juncus effusus]